MTDYAKFANLGFDSFRQLAADQSLSRHEKVGFPNSYREGKEADIFRDVCAKLIRLQRREQTVLEIGPGCSGLPVMLAELCAAQGSRLVFIDSPEMLALLPDGPHIDKLPGAFPAALDSAQFAQLQGRVDVIVVYSVIQYVFAEGNLWDFVDRCLMLLTDGGELLLGDIPNLTMRKRHVDSAAGHAQHRAFTGTDDKPEVRFNQLEPGQMDDSVVLALLARARAQGFHAWVLPQDAALPMGNRREDVLIRKP
jgi:2-polyprenyl-3-methyl-5-hydroxy-6-metoxy-1,4-benzoquinol methylase